MGSQHRFFWLHDYATVCEGYNLLRDDAVFCGAPPPGSMQCRICVYGEHRSEYRADMHALFAAIGFHVLAPSHAAFDLWLRAAELPHLSARVHANCRFTPGSDPNAAGADLALRRPVRVAFVGYPMPHKGWPLFLDLVRECSPLGIYRFYHFASADSLRRMDGLTCIPAQVDRYDRFAMASALSANAIDLVVLPSPWPETFSYVMHEALAAGADVVALEVGGNVADAVRRHHRGVVLRDGQALLQFFADLHAAHYARARQLAGPRRGALYVCGTTATVDLTAIDGPDPARFETADPDLLVIAGDRTVTPEIEGDVLRFTLPPGTGEIRLLSRRLVPGIVHPGSGDLRRLGVAVVSSCAGRRGDSPGRSQARRRLARCRRGPGMDRRRCRHRRRRSGGAGSDPGAADDLCAGAARRRPTGGLTAWREPHALPASPSAICRARGCWRAA